MEQLNRWYQTLHQHPELSRCEFETANRLSEWLTKLGLSVHRIGDTALIAELEGALPGKTVALRADMDALPVTEQTDLSYASLTSGKMHACGHDFHMTALLGAAKILTEKQASLKGKVQFIFQPDEEDLGYAAVLTTNKLLENTSAVFGAHVDPALPAGTVGIRKGVFYASSAVFDIVTLGKSAHGATPQNGADALCAAAEMVPKLLSFRESGERPAVVSVGSLHSGTVRNVIADRGELSGIIRSADVEKRREIREKICRLLQETERTYGVQTELHFAEGHRGITNPPATAAFVKEVAEECLGKDKVTEFPAPLMITEDFGEYLQGRDGCFYHIGVGGDEGLHSSRFAPDPKIIPKAAALHAAIVLKYLEEN